MAQFLLQVRDYIYSALYEPNLGYFDAKSDAVGTIPEPIWFDRIQGKFHGLLFSYVVLAIVVSIQQW